MAIPCCAMVAATASSDDPYMPTDVTVPYVVSVDKHFELDREMQQVKVGPTSSNASRTDTKKMA